MNNFNHRHPESGNILIYILGAIFLIGALTLMVKGSSTPGSGISEEALIIKVSEVQDYGRELETAISYIFQNGHSESDIRFAHPDADSAYGVITDTPTRQVFSRDGGGATYRDPPKNIQTTPTDWYFTGRNSVEGVGVNDNISQGNLVSADLVAMLNNVTKDFCLLINEKNDIENTGGNPPKDVNEIQLTLPFTGSYAETFTIGGSSGTLETFAKLEGCVEGDSNPPAGTYHYYRVLLPR